MRVESNVAKCELVKNTVVNYNHSKKELSYQLGEIQIIVFILQVLRRFLIRKYVKNNRFYCHEKKA